VFRPGRGQHDALDALHAGILRKRVNWVLDADILIRFGRHAAKQRASLGEGKPETFDFLGFTHFCTRSRKWGSFVIGSKTIKKRMRAKLKAIKVELRKRMHDPIAETGAWVKQMLQGHLNYYAVSGNHPSLWWFCNQVRWLWLKALKRRSQKARLSWERFILNSAVGSHRESSAGRNFNFRLHQTAAFARRGGARNCRPFKK
jgi:hypothetical protein